MISKTATKRITNVNKFKHNELDIIVILFSLVFIILFSIIFIFNKDKAFRRYNNVGIKDIEVIKYDEINKLVTIAITPGKKEEACVVLNNKILGDVQFNKLVDGKCFAEVPLNKQYVYFKDEYDVISLPIEVNDYVVKIDMEEKYYLALNDEADLYNEIVVVGEPKINFVNIDSFVKIYNDKITGISVGKSTITAMSDQKVINSTEVIVIDTIVMMPQMFNKDKEFLSCEQYTVEEANLLDEIIAYRINKSGYGTRAGAVAAARFLTLELPYRISYYWEAGRLNNTGRHYVDGEGRYYHTGLYLDKTKYDTLEASLFGPAMWGCKMMSYEDDPPYFKPGVRYPNGLDCSGFVSWALLNGGFDVGDRGAGELASDGQLTDLGNFRKLTSSLINSGTIKVGDLLNFSGHIAMIIGEDSNNYYVAESLNNLGGVVVETYSKTKVMNTFKYVVLMDEVYIEDGNLTNMWY